jgi:site-specific recombinase XerD
VTALAPLLQAFFTDRLMSQRQASGHTIAAYRDTLRLLLGFAADRLGRPPHTFDIGELDAPLIVAFLNHLEQQRGNSIRTRNARLSGIHSLFTYAALRHPEHAASIQRVLAIPAKRFERNLLTYLTEPEADALLAACDRSSWTGRRDHTMLLLTIQTGLRISELTGLTVARVHLGDGPYVNCVGKGRKQRRTPLLPETVAALRVWLAERAGQPDQPLFPTRTGRRLSRDAGRAPHPALRQQSRHGLPLHRQQTDNHAHAAAHRGDAATPIRSRHHRHRPMARTRASRHRPALPARRHDPKGTSDQPNHPAGHPTRPLPATRPDPGLPRNPLTQPIMPTRSACSHHPSRKLAAGSA